MPANEVKKKSKVSELRVVFETSVLYTGSASDLVQVEVTNVVREHSRHPDLKISWYLPDVVRHERQFQMQKQALSLLTYVQKLERVLGHHLNITEPIILQRIESTVETQLSDLGFSILQLDVAKVDWGRLIQDACYRKPPFVNGKSEKGFRDALIAEAFVQLIEDSPKDPRTCRVVFVTGDNGLADAVRVRTKDATNVRILDSIEALKGLINTLVEEVTEHFVETWKAKADNFFFERAKEECLYYKEKIRNRILEKFNEALNSIPHGADYRRNGTWYIGAPQFVKKQQQRVFWATRIEVEAEAYKISTAFTDIWGAGTVPSTGVWAPETVSPPATWASGSIPPSSTSDLGSATWSPRSTLREELLNKGKTVFEVIWSVQITTSGNFKAPKIESIEHVETTWE